MVQRDRALVLGGTLIACLLVYSLMIVPAVWGQNTQGTVAVTVLDPQGNVVPGAQLTLVDISTNTTRTAATGENGFYTFISLNFGSYKLTVAKNGFETHAYAVEVQAGRVTDLKAALKVGGSTQVIEVFGSATPIIETSSSAINMTVLPEQIENLPLSGRNVSSMAYLSAGYNGTWNGLPTSAQGSSIDGVIGASGRWKYWAGADNSAVTPRLESIAEMVVSTDQLDLNNGFGTSNMTITYVTRRGTNNFHGRLFEDHRNSALNAKGWDQTNAKSKLILNEFGGSVGGPILKDKLFFFGNFSMSKQPGGFDVKNAYFLPNAQNGIYTWKDDQGALHSVDLFQAVSAYNTANGTSLPTIVNSVVKQRMDAINGLLSKGNVRSDFTAIDPNVSGLVWAQSNPDTFYYPTVRVDYNVSQKHHLHGAYNQTMRNNQDAYAGYWPGDGKTGSYKTNNLTFAVGVDSTLTPTLINQFKLGYLYSSAKYVTSDTSYFDANAQITDWVYNYSNYFMSGQTYFLPTSRMQPVVNLKDDVTWSKGKHTMAFGFSAYRDQNTYWDALTGIPTVALGISDIDTGVIDALTTTSLGLPDTKLGGARQLYAVLAGRVSGINGQYTYNPATGGYGSSGKPIYNKLLELMKAWGLYAQDSYKLKPNLTLNYGLRWDFTGPNKDREGKYHSMTPADLFGPSGVWNLFNPGSLKGIDDPVATARGTNYNSWNVSPQPAFGLAWSPRSGGSLIERLLGGDKTVIRAGYSLRRFTVPQQFVWDTASNYSMGLFQNFWANPGTNPGAGIFTPGSVALGDALPAFDVSPSTYDKVIHLSESTFSGAAYSALDPKIRQPYVQSWNVGFQREIGKNRALEVRYVGNRTVHQWLGQNVNEVNVFENGFLDEFKNAQANLAINGGTNFGPGATGTHALPIMTAAGVDFTNPDFITDLQNGAVGAFAATLSSRDYFCNMVGASFGPCANAGYTGAASYPVNFFVANPYASGAWMGAKYVTDAGMSTYNSLQLELRQHDWHGLNYTANYTWSKTLGVATTGDWTSSYEQFTIRDNHSSYAPADTDRQHVINVNATYDLPFGRGKQWLNKNGVLDRILGGWTLSTIFKIRSGAPFRIKGLYQTYNDQTDGGIIMNGVSAADIQSHLGVHYVASSPGSPSIPYWIDPAYAQSLIANGKIVSNTTPGTMGRRLYLHGPHQTFDDIAISKAVPITERVRFKLQAEMLNAFNHPVFDYSNSDISNATNFGQAYYSGTPRRIEFRANIEF